MGNVNQLKQISRVNSAKEIVFNAELKGNLKEVLTSEKLKEAEKNSAEINVYSFFYKSNGHLVKGHLIEPKQGSNLPCVVWNCGGSGEFGKLKLGQLFSRPKIISLVKAGYIVIASQYSGNDGSEGQDEVGGEDVADVLNLYPILKQYSRADHKRIGMFGGSRGGMMTYQVLIQASWVKAAVSVSGVADMERNIQERPELKRKFSTMFKINQKELKKRSALRWPASFPKNKPLLIMHGTADCRVNPLDSLELAQALYRERVPYRLIVYEGADHGLMEVKDESIRQTLRWFERFVKNREKLPNLKPHGV